MAYEVLARKWRPKTFSEVVGQEHVTRTIQNALRQGRLAHAFLFTGPRGCGKTSTARILARAVNCTRIDLAGNAEPCNECETCKALFEDRELDVIEMDAASYRGIEDVRRINDTCRLAPVAGRKKVYIIDEVHMFTREAFNALLKTLEEPPEHVIFILATTDVHKVPGTILSRVQRFDFRPVQPIDVAPHLARICEAEGWPAEMEALWLIARRGEGSLRDAEGLLDQVISFAGNQVTLQTTREVLGLLPSELLAQATRLVNDRNLAGVPGYLEQLALRGTDYTEYLKTLQAYWMDLVFLKERLPVPTRSEDEIAQMKEAAADLAVDDMFRLIRLAENLEDSIKWSTAPRVRFEISFLRWATLDRVATIQQIVDRLEKGAPGAAPMAPPPAAHSASTPKPEPIPSSSAPASAPSPPVLTPAATESAAPGRISGGEITLESLQQAWPQVVRALKKKSQLLGTVAEKSWVPEKLEGKMLTVVCTAPSKFAYDQMKDGFPQLQAALAEACGFEFTVIAGPMRTEAAPQMVRPTPAPASSSSTPAAGGNDLFASFMSRFGGVEIDPGTAREPK